MAVYYNDEGDLQLIAGSTNYQFCPIGSILPFGGTTAPSGFFLCQGQALSRTEYKELFAVIGTSFGSGDGSTTFNLPDLRGEFLRGAGTNSHSGEGSGGNVGTHQGATKVPSIITRQNNIATANFNDPAANNAVENPDYGTILPTSNGVGIDYSIQGTVYSTTLNSIKYTTRPTNTSVNYIIKAKVVGEVGDAIQEYIDEVTDSKIQALGLGNFYTSQSVTASNSNWGDVTFTYSNPIPSGKYMPLMKLYNNDYTKDTFVIGNIRGKNGSSYIPKNGWSGQGTMMFDNGPIIISAATSSLGAQVAIREGVEVSFQLQLYKIG